MTSPAHGVMITAWQASDGWSNGTSQHDPTVRLAIVGAPRAAPPKALRRVTEAIHVGPHLDAALSVAHLRAQRPSHTEAPPQISALVIEISPTQVHLVRIGAGEVWLRADGRTHWTPAFPVLAPGAWASPPLGYPAPIHYETCRVTRRSALGIVLASPGTGLGELRLNNLATWLDAKEAPADESDGGLAVLSAQICAGV